jgi:large subunit ribosomal protein L12
MRLTQRQVPRHRPRWKRRKRRKPGSTDWATSSVEKKVKKMEYVYAAMLLHSAEKNIDEDAVSAVLTAAGVDVDGARVKALVASLGSVDIGEAMATAVAAPVASAAPAASGGGGAEAAPAEEEAAEEEPEEEGAGFEGLGSLFG